MRTALIVYALLALGCSAEVAAPIADTAPSDTPLKPVVAAIDGKPGPPIDVAYRLLSEPTVGQPLEIELVVNTALPVDTWTVKLNALDDLVLGANQSDSVKYERSAGAGREALAQRVTVIPQAEGRSYLAVYISVPDSEGAAAKVMSIPVQVGDLPRRLQRNGTLSGSGEDAVVSMPARETTE